MADEERPLRGEIVSWLGTAVVPYNPRIRQVARSLSVKPATLVAQIEAHLPSKIEQQAYLAASLGSRIRPETFAKIMRTILGRDEFQAHHLAEVPVGPNLVQDRFADVFEVVEHTLVLLDKEYDIRIAAEDAANLACLLGAEAEMLLESLYENVSYARDMLPSLAKVRRTVIVGTLVKAIVKLHRRSSCGLPVSTNAIDYIQYIRDTGALRRFEEEE